MLKIRLQGTKRDIQWFMKVLTYCEMVEILQSSKILSNKGTDKYYRMYAEVEQKEVEELPV